MTQFERMEIYEGPDRDGRYHFALFWIAPHPGDKVAGIAPGEIRERGQHFRADPKHYPARVVIDLRGRGSR